MVKQKNDVIAAQQRRTKQLKIILLLVAAFGLGCVFLSTLKITDPQALLEFIHFPEQSQIFEPFCIGIGGLGDKREAIGSYNPSVLMEFSELYIDGMIISQNQLHIALSTNLPGYINFCFLRGLDRGQYQLEFKLKDSLSNVLTTHQWILTISQEFPAQAILQNKIDTLIVHPWAIPEHISDVTQEAHIHEPICISVNSGSTDQRAHHALELALVMSLNDVALSSDKIKTHVNTTAPTVVIFCLDRGLDEGHYLMGLKLKEPRSDDIFAYQWVLRVTP